MPTLDATTSAAFNSAGVSANTLYSFLQTVFGQAFSVMIWLIEAIWTFLLVLGVISVFVGIAYAMLHRHR